MGREGNLRRFENDRFLGGGNRESHCLFVLMREAKGICFSKKFKKLRFYETFFRYTLESKS